jgi:hypothetical protein
MDFRGHDKLDCKIPIRKYVLITQPTRWSQKGGRVVVHSPMLNIGTTISYVPVKCCHGSGQNDVDFLPKSNIEKDTKDVYEKLYVSKKPSSDYAHGVAAFNSRSSDDFKYKRGHRFWICIGADTIGHQKRVSVVNLNTYQKGRIRIDQVRWFPNIRGPGLELWTLGGSIKLLKLCGPNNYKSFSWAICQYSNGKPSITNDVEIPTEHTPLANRSLLSTQESQTLFDAQCKVMEETAIRSHLPTPPASPEPVLAPVLWHKAKLWRRISRVAEERQKRRGASYVLRTSTISTQRSSLQKRHEAIRASIGVQSNWDEIYDDLNCDQELQPGSRDSSPSCLVTADTQATSRKKAQAEVLTSASDLLDISRSEGKADLSVTNPATTRDPAAANWDYWKEHNPLLEDLCDLNILDCPYVKMSTAKHFHSPPEKCPSFSFTHFLDLDSDRSYKAPLHEHCISRLKPYPLANICLLASSPIRYPNHECCQWSAFDMEGLTIEVQQEENVKVCEARRNKVKLRDMSWSVSGQAKLPFDVSNSIHLDEGGKGFNASLQGVLLDKQVEQWPASGLNTMDGQKDWSIIMDNEIE